MYLHSSLELFISRIACKASPAVAIFNVAQATRKVRARIFFLFQERNCVYGFVIIVMYLARATLTAI